MTRSRLGKLAAAALGSAVVLALYAFVIDREGPSSQSAGLAVVVDGVDPENGAGLRVDVVIEVPVSTLGGCEGARAGHPVRDPQVLEAARARAARAAPRRHRPADVLRPRVAPHP